MVCVNSSNKNNQPNKQRKTLASVYFDNISEKSLEQNLWHKNIKYRQSMIAQEEHTNAAIWQNVNLEKIIAKIERDLRGVLSINFEMQSIYIQYLDKAKKAYKKYNEICTCALELEHELYISNEEREQTISLLEQ